MESLFPASAAVALPSLSAWYAARTSPGTFPSSTRPGTLRSRLICEDEPSQVHWIPTQRSLLEPTSNEDSHTHDRIHYPDTRTTALAFFCILEMLSINGSDLLFPYTNMVFWISIIGLRSLTRSFETLDRGHFRRVMNMYRSGCEINPIVDGTVGTRE